MASRILGELQIRLVMAAQEASPSVRLVGGTGLALLLEHRISDDVDLFCAQGEEIGVVVQAVIASAAGAGVVATAVRSGPFYQQAPGDRRRERSGSRGYRGRHRRAS